ncbi:MAG: M48 family metalloprotease, partial [Gammaproteobacteria bacterium]|nr:M48 family metalloprotease [Gammaproteobacteria bacterium]
AHEMAHVLARHHLRALTNEKRFGLMLDLAQSASGADGLLEGMALAATKELYSSGLSQGDEFEADRMGVVIAARAGYDPYGLLNVLMSIEATATDAEFSGFFLSTHPPTAARMDALNDPLDRVFGGIDYASMDAGFAALQRRLLGARR